MTDSSIMDAFEWGPDDDLAYLKAECPLGKLPEWKCSAMLGRDGYLTCPMVGTSSGCAIAQDKAGYADND